jgi:hypothetical protein
MRRTTWLVVLCCAVSLAAQSSRNYKARLSTVPIDLTLQATIAGTGAVTALLTASKLAITGTFDGLKSPATIAQLHRSSTRGVRGPSFADLTVTHATTGSLTGSIELNPAQVADLEKGRLYVQIHSEKAPDGNLWGWLLPQESKR